MHWYSLYFPWLVFDFLRGKTLRAFSDLVSKFRVSMRVFAFAVPFVPLKSSLKLNLRKFFPVTLLVLVGCHIPLFGIWLIDLNGYFQWLRSWTQRNFDLFIIVMIDFIRWGILTSPTQFLQPHYNFDLGRHQFTFSSRSKTLEVSNMLFVCYVNNTFQ